MAAQAAAATGIGIETMRGIVTMIGSTTAIGIMIEMTTVIGIMTTDGISAGTNIIAVTITSMTAEIVTTTIIAKAISIWPI